MNESTRNYHAHGGSEWVIGGKLTFLPGATVEGAENILNLPSAATTVLPNIPASDATTIAALREDYNQLLSALKTTGLMTPDPTIE
ncbi:MAG TPA: Head fiber protein [Candidatus Limiplasma sp.]|nr:Head fiber protein [Candidatus Limiplasma sp.]